MRRRPALRLASVLLMAGALPASAPAARAQQPAADHVPTPSRDATRDATRGGRRALVAARRESPVRLDARLDEPAWAGAAVADGFVQRQPTEGAPASERTEVRILYDDEALWVGAALYDAHPDSIVAPLGRRDAAPPSDGFYVQLDSYHDRRTAFVFHVTAAGVQTDLVITDGIDVDPSWDAVWAVATRRDSLGWYAEYRIPLGQLRYGRAEAEGDGAVWGLNLLRWIARRNEDAQWSLIPRTAATWVPHYGELRGLRLRGAPRRLEVRPYALARLARGATGDAPPAAARAGGAATLGGDLRWAVTPGLTLTATVNPDFGQVEADPSVVNLTAFEVFTAERRPFFVEGADIFRRPTSEWYDVGELFHSRRIGRAPQLDLPDGAAAIDRPAASTILGAAKLSGRTASGWSLGALGAVTGAEHARLAGPGDAEALVEPRAGYAVARALRTARDGETTYGVIATGVLRDAGDPRAASELRRRALVGGADARHRFGGGAYELSGWLVGSHVAGTAAAIAATQRGAAHRFQRPDADHMALDTTRTALAGAAASLRAAKVGGNWRWILSARAFSPGFEPNDLGFQPRSDLALAHASLGYDRPDEGRWHRGWFAFANHFAGWTTGGERTSAASEVVGQVRLRNWWTVFAGARHALPVLSADALRGGPALRVDANDAARVELTTDERRAAVGSLVLFALRGAAGERRAEVAPSLTLRPTPRAELSLGARAARQATRWQYVDEVAVAGRPTYVLGHLAQSTAALTARASYAFTRTATLQLYAQPFLSAGRYAALAEVTDPRARHPNDRARVHPTAALARDGDAYLADADGDGAPDWRVDRPDFNRRELIANAVLRWEYRPGSTLFLVWSHAREGDAADPDGSLRLGAEARALGTTRARDVLLVKVSYWWDR